MQERGPARWSWGALALLGAAVAAAAVALRSRFDVAVRLGEGRMVPATAVLAVLAAVAVGLAAVGPHRRRLALTGLAAVAFAVTGAWLLLTDHRFSGPVVASFGHGHGLHLTDLASVVPTLVGLAVLARAVRRSPVRA